MTIDLQLAFAGVIAASVLEVAGTHGLTGPVTAERLLWPAGRIEPVWQRMCLAIAPVVALGFGVVGGSLASPSRAVALGLACLALHALGAVAGRLGGMAISSLVLRSSDDRAEQARQPDAP